MGAGLSQNNLWPQASIEPEYRHGIINWPGPIAIAI